MNIHDGLYVTSMVEVDGVASRILTDFDSYLQ